MVEVEMCESRGLNPRSVNASQSTSQHSILDDPNQIAWVTLDVEVLKLDA